MAGMFSSLDGEYLRLETHIFIDILKQMDERFVENGLYTHLGLICPSSSVLAVTTLI